MRQFLRKTEFLQKYPLEAILALGVIVKVLLMPFTAHPDLLLTYGRAIKIAFFGENVFNQTQLIPHALEALWVKLISLVAGQSIFLPSFSQLGQLTNPELMHLFLDQSELPNVTIFLFKLLYLIVDIFVLVAIYKWFLRDQPLKVRLSGVAFYWLNPLIIFSVYMFGRYEVMVAGLLLILIWLIKESKFAWSAVAMAALILTRSSMVLILPGYILSLPISWGKRIGLAFISVLPFAATFLLKSSAQATSQLEWLSSGQHSDYIFNGLPLNSIYTEIYFFWFVFIAFLIWFWQQKFKLETYKLVSACISMTFGIYYITSFYHPQYLVWSIVPLGVVLLNLDRKSALKMLKLLGVLVLVLPIQLLTWRKDILMGIFLPLNTTLGSKDLAGVIDNFFDARDLANLGWTAAAVVWAFTCFYIWQYLRSHLQHE